MEYDWFEGELTWVEYYKVRPAMVVGTDENSDKVIVVFGTTKEKYENNPDYVKIHDTKLSKPTYFNCSELVNVDENEALGGYRNFLEVQNITKVMAKVKENFPSR